MKKIPLALQVLFVVAVIVIGGAWEIISAFRGQYPITNFPPKSGTVIAFGDSLTVGVGATAGSGFVDVLSKRLNVPIVNKGVSGDTTADALQRVDSDVIALHPGVVMILLGGNDHLQRIPPEETFANLETLIKKVQSGGSVVLLLGLDGFTGDRNDGEFEALAKRTGSLYVADVMSGIIGDPKLMTDEVHPNDAGYLRMADKIAPTLDGIVLALPKDVSTNSPEASSR